MEVGLAIALVAIVIGLLALSRAQRAEAVSRQLAARVKALELQLAVRADVATVETKETGEAEALVKADEPIVAADVLVETKPATVEQAIGLVWVTRIGAALLAVGAIYFFQVAVERGWLGPWGRVGVGLGAAAVAIGIAAAVRKKTSATWVAVLVGIGLAIALGAVWAAHALYQLVPGLVAFGAVTGIVLGAAALAAAWRMQAVLGTATLSAFVNLGALSTGLPGHAALAGYALVVGAVAIIVAADKRWPIAGLIVAPGAIGAFIVRHFGIVGIPLNVTSEADAGLAIALAVTLGAIIVWGARDMPAPVRRGMHAGAGLFAAGVAVSLYPYAAFAVMALVLAWRVLRPEPRAPMLNASVVLITLVGLCAVPLPMAAAVAGGAGILVAAVGRTRVDAALIGGGALAASIYLADLGIAAGAGAAALVSAIGLAVLKERAVGVMIAVALGLAGAMVVLAKLPLGLSAALVGLLAIAAATLAGLVKKRAPAWVAPPLAALSMAHAVVAQELALLAFGGLALALFPFCAGRDRGAYVAANVANVARGAGLVALALAVVSAAGGLFAEDGAKTVAQTLALGAFGAAVVAWGFMHQAVLDRWFGLATLGAAVVKLVVWDVFKLDVVARTLILVLFGVLLLVSGFLYARSMARKR